MRLATRTAVPAQRVRLASAILYGAALMVVSYWLTGNWTPPFGLKGLWFYTALVGLLLGRALVEPYFTRPADAAVNSVGLALTVIAVSRADTTVDDHYFIWGRAVLLVYAAAVAILSMVAILFKDSVSTRRLAAWSSRQAGRIGRADVMYSVLFAASLYAAFSTSAPTALWLALAWFVITFVRPLEHAAGRLFEVTSPTAGLPVVTYEDPGIAVAAYPEGFRPLRGTEVRQQGRRIGQVVDHTVTAAIPRVRIAMDKPGELIRDQVPLDTPPVPPDRPPIGFVREETTTESLVFHLPSGNNAAVTEGELVETVIAEATVLFQVTDARVVEHRDLDTLRRVTRVEARKLGEWSNGAFAPVPWLPAPNTLISRFVASDVGQASPLRPIGCVPGTPYRIGVDADQAISHNTAIVGILGSGKTRLAWRLMDAMLAVGNKCLVVDITGHYVPRFEHLQAGVVSEAFHRDVTEACSARLNNDLLDNHGESGNSREFRRAIVEQVKAFVEGPTSC